MPATSRHIVASFLLHTRFVIPNLSCILPDHCIFQAIVDDAVCIFDEGTGKHAGTAIPTSRYAANGRKTVFGREYSLLVIDEAHEARKYNKLHLAARQLRTQSKAIIAMTATTVTTKPQASPPLIIPCLIPSMLNVHSLPQDLWIFGQLLGIPSFSDHSEHQQMNRDLSGAIRRDRRHQRQATAASNPLSAVFVGSEPLSDMSDLEYPQIMTRWMVKMREYYAKHVIRRTVNSVDHAGNKIFGIEPYLEHPILVKMYDWEMANLGHIARTVIKQHPLATLIGASKVTIHFSNPTTIHADAYHYRTSTPTSGGPCSSRAHTVNRNQAHGPSQNPRMPGCRLTTRSNSRSLRRSSSTIYNRMVLGH
jgi:hypothetical protein